MYAIRSYYGIGTERGQPQVQVEIDRSACAAFGVDPRVVAEGARHAQFEGVGMDCCALASISYNFV